MVIDCCRFNFSFGKFKSSALAELVGYLAGDFDSDRAEYDEEKKRRRLLRLAWRKKRRREEINKAI